MAPNDQSQQPISMLREYLRQPPNKITSADPVPDHRNTMSAIWQQALDLTGGNPQVALNVATEATRSSQQPGESRDEYLARLDGIPSQVFTDIAPYQGVDKAQHFFATADLAYNAALGTTDYTPFVGWSPPMTGVGEIAGKLGGKLYEAKDGIEGLFGKDSGGYDHGDIYADDQGAAFGSALATLIDFNRPEGSELGNPYSVSISDYLVAPGESPAPQFQTPPAAAQPFAPRPDDVQQSLPNFSQSIPDSPQPPNNLMSSMDNPPVASYAPDEEGLNEPMPTPAIPDEGYSSTPLNMSIPDNEALSSMPDDGQMSGPLQSLPDDGMSSADPMSSGPMSAPEETGPASYDPGMSGGDVGAPGE